MVCLAGRFGLAALCGCHTLMSVVVVLLGGLECSRIWIHHIVVGGLDRSDLAALLQLRQLNCVFAI